jgi:hypothetical protein
VLRPALRGPANAPRQQTPGLQSGDGMTVFSSLTIAALSALAVAAAALIVRGRGAEREDRTKTR